MLLLCVSDAPRLRILRWTKDDRPLPTNDRRISDLGGFIIIEAARLSDSGVYRCLAEYAGESLAAAVSVQVAGIEDSFSAAVSCTDTNEDGIQTSVLSLQVCLAFMRDS